MRKRWSVLSRGSLCGSRIKNVGQHVYLQTSIVYLCLFSIMYQCSSTQYNHMLRAHSHVHSPGAQSGLQRNFDTVSAALKTFVPEVVAEELTLPRPARVSHVKPPFCTLRASYLGVASGLHQESHITCPAQATSFRARKFGNSPVELNTLKGRTTYSYICCYQSIKKGRLARNVSNILDRAARTPGANRTIRPAPSK